MESLFFSSASHKKVFGSGGESQDLWEWSSFQRVPHNILIELAFSSCRWNRVMEQICLLSGEEWEIWLEKGNENWSREVYVDIKSLVARSLS